MKLKPNFAIEYAKSFTTTAMEHSMIATSKDPKETAKNVTDFFNALCDELTVTENDN